MTFSTIKQIEFSNFLLLFPLFLNKIILYKKKKMTTAVQLLRDQVAKELQGSVTIIGKFI